MPIRRELRHLYPLNWRQLSDHVRFSRAKGRCEGCKRPHLAVLRCLPDGRWYDERTATWRDGRGRRRRRSPDLLAWADSRRTRVVLAAAHVNGDTSNSSRRNLRAWCQRCHLLHDQAQHRMQRWITYRARYAAADLFLGCYEALALVEACRAH